MLLNRECRLIKTGESLIKCAKFSKLAKDFNSLLMQIIHTADWHLGQTFYSFERTYEHRVFLDWLANILKERKTDLLLIAGDVFDSPNPSAEAQRMFYTFLRRVTTENPDLQVIITAGNHDSAARLEAPNPLLKTFKTHVSGIVHYKNDEIDYERMIVPVGDDTCCLAVPYLRHNDLPKAETYSEGIAKFYSNLYEIAKEKYSRIIAMGHLQASGAEVSVGDNSEHAIIGGLEGIDSGFAKAGISYFALGHLHKAQRVGGREHVRYSGAPLPMSFAERKNIQSVTQVNIDNQGTTIERIIFDAPVKLLSIPEKPSPIEEILPLLAALEDGEINNRSPFLEIKVLVKSVDPTLRNQIEQAIAGKSVRLARLESVCEKKEGEKRVVTFEEFKKTSPNELIEELYMRMNGEEMPIELKDIMDDIIKEVVK